MDLISQIRQQIAEIKELITDSSKEIPIIPLETMREILLEENRRRLSPETQEIYAQTHRQNGHQGDWIDHTHQLQKNLLKDFGYGEEYLFQLRTATQRYPELKEIPLYIKYNRAKIGNLRQNDSAPDIPMYDRNLAPLNLLDAQEKKRPIFVCAASWT